jgi:hypothetical protein
LCITLGFELHFYLPCCHALWQVAWQSELKRHNTSWTTLGNCTRQLYMNSQDSNLTSMIRYPMTWTCDHANVCGASCFYSASATSAMLWPPYNTPLYMHEEAMSACQYIRNLGQPVGHFHCYLRQNIWLHCMSLAGF